MSWAHSLIRVRDFEIETLRKRLGVIMEAKIAAEAALRVLDTEADAETAHARKDAEAGWYLIGFREGWKLRKAKALADFRAVVMEEQGCRDALSDAFTELKKVEMVAEAQAAAAAKVIAKREGAALDEIALRMTGT
jgi:flagellar FliJ protein